MAFQAPRHIEGLNLLDFDHLVDATVAGDATDTDGDVRLMIEIDVVGKHVDVDPRYGLAGLVAFTDGCQQSRLFFHLRVAVHAGFGGRDGGVSGLFDRRVAVVAVHTEVTGVQLMAVRYWLDGGITCVLNTGTHVVIRETHTAQGRHDEHGAAESSEEIELFREYLRHASFRTPGWPTRLGGETFAALTIFFYHDSSTCGKLSSFLVRQEFGNKVFTSSSPVAKRDEGSRWPHQQTVAKLF